MRFLLVIACLALTSCGKKPNDIDDYEAALRETLQNTPLGKAEAYALMKNTVAGPAWLATIHGYPDNLSVCEELIQPYNEDKSLSTLPGEYYYECV